MKADPSLTSHATAHDVDVWRIGRARHDERARSKVTSSRAGADRAAPRGELIELSARPSTNCSRRLVLLEVDQDLGDPLGVGSLRQPADQRRAVSLGPDKDIEQFGSASLANCCDDAAGKVGPLRHGLRRPRFRLPGPILRRGQPSTHDPEDVRHIAHHVPDGAFRATLPMISDESLISAT